MQPKFLWGPLARAIYIGMLWFTIVIGWHFSNFLIYYIPLLIFLGIGLRPLVEHSGVYDFYEHYSEKIVEGKWGKIGKKKGIEIDRKVRDKKYRQNRVKDSRLPKNW